jgi:triosephosphate isomerase
MRLPLVVGNWKMNTRPEEASALAQAASELARELADTAELGVAPPMIWLERVRAAGVRPLFVYGQNCSAHDEGAHTGEVSAPMVAQAGANGVILGHSERRHVYGETDADVASRLVAARRAELDVILCVGETLDARDQGRTWDVVRAQLEGGLTDLESAEGVTIAYEPVWAIGTGRTATPEQAREVHGAIRAWWTSRFGDDAAAALRILYGGSVKPSNAAALMAQPDIDGALVGGASLSSDDFAAIARAAADAGPASL